MKAMGNRKGMQIEYTLDLFKRMVLVWFVSQEGILRVSYSSRIQYQQEKVITEKWEWIIKLISLLTIKNNSKLRIHLDSSIK